MDMYIPKSASKGDALPTVVFVTGGAWTIGYKAWGALLARRLCDAGVITMCLDYRNFPQVTPAQGFAHGSPVAAWAGVSTVQMPAGLGQAGSHRSRSSVKTSMWQKFIWNISHGSLQRG